MLNLVEDNGHLVATVLLTEANLNNAEMVKLELIRVLDQYQRSVILDLEKVTYVDSAFLGALVSTLKHAMTMKLDVVLTGLHKDIHDLLKLIRLDRVFKIYSTVPDAQKNML